MSPRYVRNEPDARQEALAGVLSGILAAATGLVTFYFVRLLLARDAVPDGSGSSVERDDGGVEH